MAVPADMSCYRLAAKRVDAELLVTVHRRRLGVRSRDGWAGRRIR